MKANNHTNAKNLKGFKGNIPKAIVEIDRHPETQRILFSRKVDHVIGNAVYHPTKGYRKVRQYNPHTLLNSLLVSIGLNSMYPNL